MDRRPAVGTDVVEMDVEPAEYAVCDLDIMSERGVPEGQEDPAFSFRTKIEFELEENEAQEAYYVEKEYGNIVEEPFVKLEMPKMPSGKIQVFNSIFLDRVRINFLRRN